MSDTRGRRFETAPLEYAGEPLRTLDQGDADAVFSWLQSEISERGIPVYFHAGPETGTTRGSEQR